MPTGLVALLDDIAGITKLAAASLDDIGAATGKAGSKAIGVVVDDAGVLAVDGQTQPGLVPRPVTLLTRCEVEQLEIHGQDAVGDGPKRLLRAMRGLPHD